MKLAFNTERLHVFETEPFVVHDDYWIARRIQFVAYPRDGGGVHTIMPVATALVQLPGILAHPFVDGIETSSLYRDHGFGVEVARGLIDRFDGEIRMCAVTKESAFMLDKLPVSEFIERLIKSSPGMVPD